ncbi:MAG: hypothetical protein M3067_12735 [Chloroflexota bacterium]|nr:hypothetical protein [Chloroflexota bacterium]
MIRRDRATCARFQAALIEFAERPVRAAGTAAALAHLERCRACEDELAGIMRTIAGLRSLARSLNGVEPGPESWPILRARVSHPEPSPWRWSYSLGGVIATAAIALLVLPWIGSSPVRPPTGLETPAGPGTIDRREDVASTPLLPSPRAAGASLEKAPRTVRPPANGPSRVPVDGEPARVALSTGTGWVDNGSMPVKQTLMAPDPSMMRPGAARPIDAI